VVNENYLFQLFQSSFSEALYCYGGGGVDTPLSWLSFNPHFQRLFTATEFLRLMPVGKFAFQSSFSEALYCYTHPTG